MPHGNMRKIIPESVKDLKKEMGGPTKPLYPHFSIDMKHLPEAKEWDPPNEYYITLKLKMNEKIVGRDHNHAGFDIIGIEPQLSKKEKNLRDKIRDY